MTAHPPLKRKQHASMLSMGPTLSSCHLTASACVPLFSGPPDLTMMAITSSTAQPCITGQHKSK
jgi:hypothetical protein